MECECGCEHVGSLSSSLTAHSLVFPENGAVVGMGDADEQVGTLGRAFAAQVCAALLAAILCGCCSISVTHELGEDPDRGPLGGRYRLDGVDALLVVAMRKHAPDGVVFADDEDASALPLKIDFREIGEEKDETSALQVLPGCLTLMMLPAFYEHHMMYRVRVESPLGIDSVDFKQIKRDAFSSLPIGFLPYAFSLDGYANGITDHNTLDKETRMDAVAEGLTNAVAQAVISTLSRVKPSCRHCQKCVMMLT